LLTIQTRVNGMLGLASKAGKISFGVDATSEAIEKETAKLIIIAKDTSENTAKKIERLSVKKNIKSIYFGTIEENSLAIGKFNKAIIAIRDENFSKAILKIISGGDATWVIK